MEKGGKGGKEKEKTKEENEKFPPSMLSSLGLVIKIISNKRKEFRSASQDDLSIDPVKYRDTTTKSFRRV